jgi:hypothetical protein
MSSGILRTATPLRSLGLALEQPLMRGQGFKGLIPY